MSPQCQKQLELGNYCHMLAILFNCNFKDAHAYFFRKEIYWLIAKVQFDLNLSSPGPSRIMQWIPDSYLSRYISRMPPGRAHSNCCIGNVSLDSSWSCKIGQQEWRTAEGGLSSLGRSGRGGGSPGCQRRFDPCPDPRVGEEGEWH